MLACQSFGARPFPIILGYVDFRTRRQLAVIAAVGVVAVGVFWFLLRGVLPEPSCADGRRNQGEERVDCGSPCLPCVLREERAFEVFWVRHVQVRANTYDVAAEVKNPNVRLGAAAVPYEFKLFDTVGVAVASRRGLMFVYPGEAFHIAEVGLTSARTIRNATLTFGRPAWVVTEDVGPDVIAGGKAYAVEGERGEEQSVVTAVVSNRTLGFIRDIAVIALAFDSDGNLLGAHRTIIAELPAGAQQPVKFVWPTVFKTAAASVVVETRSPAHLTPSGP